MATYEETASGNGMLLLKELQHKETALYGSSRLGMNRYLNKVIETSVELNPEYDGPIFTTMMLNRISQDLRISELQYDSPLTEEGGNEAHLGEYLILYNRGEIDLPLEGVELRSKNNPLQKVVFSQGTILSPEHSLIVAYGTAADRPDFLVANNLEKQELDQREDVQWYWQEDLHLSDLGDQVLLKKPQAPFGGYPQGLEITIDLAEYGTNNKNSYENEYYDLNRATYTDLRPLTYALQREEKALKKTSLSKEANQEKRNAETFLEVLNSDPLAQEMEIYTAIYEGEGNGYLGGYAGDSQIKEEVVLTQAENESSWEIESEEQSFKKPIATKGGNSLSLNTKFKRERSLKDLHDEIYSRYITQKKS